MRVDLSLIYGLLLLVAMTSCNIYLKDEKLYYDTWLGGKWLRGDFIRISEKTRRVVPFEIKVTNKGSLDEHCNKTESYCLAQTQKGSDLPIHCERCKQPPCAFPQQQPLDEYLLDIPWLVRLKGTPIALNKSYEECGILTGSNSISFVGPRNGNKPCGLDNSMPYIALGGHLDGFTLVFTINMPKSASSQSRILLITAGLAGNDSFGFRIFPDESVDQENVTIRVFRSPSDDNVYQLMAHASHPSTVFTLNSSVESIAIGSTSYRGSIQNIKFYSTIASTSEIFAIESGRELIKHYSRPECDCPREFIDSFNLIAEQKQHANQSTARLVNEGFCSDLRNGSIHSRYLNGSVNYGKTSLFGSDRWQSPLTDETEISITFPQPFFVYVLSGTFEGPRPSAVELRFHRNSGSAPDIQIYVSDDCQQDYGLSPRVQMLDDTGEPYSNLNASVPFEPICFLWDNSTNLYSELVISVVTPEKLPYYLNDGFSSKEITLKLIGHHGIANNTRQNWYKLGRILVYGSPHCSGHNYTLVPSPTDISSYYDYYGENTKLYTCHCPEGINGQHCTGCHNVKGAYKYVKEGGACANCACTDLATSKTCANISGQCSCSTDVNQTLAGRQCNWYIKNIIPHYGPEAGKTVVTISGGYLDMGVPTVELAGVPQVITDQSAKEIVFQTMPYEASDVAKELAVSLNSTTANIGPSPIYQLFEYRPNSIIEEIKPRKTILSGGVAMTVTGRYLNSVAFPKIIIFVRQYNNDIGSVTGPCKVINETEMVCTTPDVYEMASPYLDGKIFSVAGYNEYMARRTTKSTTTSTPTTTTGDTATTTSTTTTNAKTTSTTTAADPTTTSPTTTAADTTITSPTTTAAATTITSSTTTAADPTTTGPTTTAAATTITSPTTTAAVTTITSPTTTAAATIITSPTTTAADTTTTSSTTTAADPTTTGPTTTTAATTITSPTTTAADTTITSPTTTAADTTTTSSTTTAADPTTTGPTTTAAATTTTSPTNTAAATATTSSTTTAAATTTTSPTTTIADTTTISSTTTPADATTTNPITTAVDPTTTSSTTTAADTTTTSPTTTIAATASTSPTTTAAATTNSPTTTAADTTTTSSTTTPADATTTSSTTTVTDIGATTPTTTSTSTTTTTSTTTADTTKVTLTTTVANTPNTPTTSAVNTTTTPATVTVDTKTATSTTTLVTTPAATFANKTSATSTRIAADTINLTSSITPITTVSPTLTAATITATAQSKVLDSSNAKQINTDGVLNGRNGVQFSLGLQLDGIPDYADMEKSPDPAIKAMARVLISVNPKLYDFKYTHGKDVLVHKVSDNIELTGVQLTSADLGLDDYKITLGVDSVCEPIHITTNRLICRPPTELPAAHSELSKVYRNRKVPRIEVQIGTGNLVYFIGYVHYWTNEWEENDAMRIAILAIAAVLAFLAIVFVYRKRDKICSEHKTYQAENSYEELDVIIATSSSTPTPCVWITLRSDIEAKVNQCKISRDDVSVGEHCLGKGFFGVVYKGQLRKPDGAFQTVAIKGFKDTDEVTIKDIEKLLEEGTLMINFKHANVLSLIGVVFEGKHRPFVILPFMEHGNLHRLISKEEMKSTLGIADLLFFAHQIANGMAYLHEQKCVHRDLAARNCLVDSGFLVKISDFGMSVSVGKDEYYRMSSMNKPLPTRWTAMESLREGRYTYESDVWSFGVTMWELFTHGAMPYLGMKDQAIKDFLNKGARLDKPTACPLLIYGLMTKCWEEFPSQRPLFPDIVSFFERHQQEIDVADSAYGAEYFYARSATRSIPSNYTQCPDYLTGAYLDIDDDDDDLNIMDIDNGYFVPIFSANELNLCHAGKYIDLNELLSSI